MKADQHTHRISRKGFTLLEIIVSITIAGIMGAILIQFAGTAITLSANPLKIVRDEVSSQGIMEEIMAQYVKEINEAPATALADLITFIGTQSYSSNVTTCYITFAADGSEQSPASCPGSATNYLKVVVQVNDHQQTSILSKSRSGSTEELVTF